MLAWGEHEVLSGSYLKPWISTMTGPVPQAARLIADKAEAGESFRTSPSEPAFSLRMGMSAPPTTSSGAAMDEAYDGGMNFRLQHRDGVDVQLFWS